MKHGSVHNPARDWLVWSNQRGGWWRASGHGYTQILTEAGRFTAAEADAILEQANLTCPPDRPNEVRLAAPAPGLFAAADAAPLLAAAGRAVDECLGPVPAPPVPWHVLLSSLAVPNRPLQARTTGTGGGRHRGGRSPRGPRDRLTVCSSRLRARAGHVPGPQCVPGPEVTRSDSPTEKDGTSYGYLSPVGLRSAVQRTIPLREDHRVGQHRRREAQPSRAR